MSLPLKPLTLDSNSKQLDSRQKKFCSNVEKAIKKFDLVNEWADYIASLGTLLKALQSWSPKFQNVKYFVPYPYDVSRRLSSSLSPSLPAGVHLKTLEVYTYIFENIGIEALAHECNIWIPGILPLMTYASMSVRSRVIELYDNYILTLPSEILKVIIRPLLSSLFPGLEDESSEYLDQTIKLIETLQENLGDDSLFWQTCFLVISTYSDRRAGGLVWLTRKFPSLNAIPHKIAERNKIKVNSTGGSTNSMQDRKKVKEDALATLLPSAKNLVTPEPGLLIRCLVSCLEPENDILIKRGILDLLLQRVRIDSPVIQVLISPEDKKLLIMSCCKTTLNKDMSLNRRVWNWCLGFSSSTTRSSNGSTTSVNSGASDKGDNSQDKSNEYFRTNGLLCLKQGIEDLLYNETDVVTAFKLCISIMDRWEIGSMIIPTIFTNLLLASYKMKENELVMKAAGVFFDAVETNIIWGNVINHFFITNDIFLIQFVINNFNISTDEEIIVNHLPLVLLSLLTEYEIFAELDGAKQTQYYNLCYNILTVIPERAFTTISNSTVMDISHISDGSVIEAIKCYYGKVSDPSSFMISDANSIERPYSMEVMTALILNKTTNIVLSQLHNQLHLNDATKLFIYTYEKIPESNQQAKKIDTIDDELSNTVFGSLKKITETDMEYISGLVDLFGNYLCKRMDFIESIKLLNLLVQSLWPFLKVPKSQDPAIRCLESIERSIPTDYVESAVANAFAKEESLNVRIDVLNLLWISLPQTSTLYIRPLEIIFDELNNSQNPYYLSVSKWIYSLNTAGTINNLFRIIMNQLSEFEFFKRDTIKETDDLDMFTYRIQIIKNVLSTNNHSILKTFASEINTTVMIKTLGNEDVSTYKSCCVAIIINFLKKQNNTHPRSIRSSLVLLDLLLDGSEANFKEIVIFLLEKSSFYISQGEIESELIAVALIDIVSKVLMISHQNGIKLDIFDDNSTHLKYIDYLVTSVSTMEGPFIVTAYVKLLSESIAYFENSIFRTILPLTASMVQCIGRLFEKEKESGGYLEPILLLLGGLEELLEVSHGFLTAGEKDNYFGNTAKSDFLQSVVSNVFSSENTAVDIKIQGERDVIIQSFKQVTNSAYRIWSWAHIQSRISLKSNPSNSGTHANYKLKFGAKKLLEKLYILEPLETLETLISTNKNETTVPLIQALDGNRPALTIPSYFSSIVLRCNKNSTVRFSSNTSSKTTTFKGMKSDPSLLNKLHADAIMQNLLDYVKTLENTAMEDFYGDYILFLKEVSNNQYLYKNVCLQVMDLCVVIADKLSRSKFGEQKRPRKDLSDLCFKYIPAAVEGLAKSKENYNHILETLTKVTRNITLLLNENDSGDKVHAVITSIISNIVVPHLKTEDAVFSMPEFMSLLTELVKVSGRVKLWRQVIGDAFNDDTVLIEILQNIKWQDIIFKWSDYEEHKYKLLSDLTMLVTTKKSALAPTAISFNSWGDSEDNTKKKNVLRIAYLLMISPKDYYLMHFEPLISYALSTLSSQEHTFKSEFWALLRVIFMKFSLSHFTSTWPLISYALQTNLQEFYENIQIQNFTNPEATFQLCKTLDQLLAMNIEGFCATNEWIFIIDTINCIYKTNSYVALADSIASCKEFEITTMDDLNLSKNISSFKPLLLGVHKIDRHNQLRSFFQNLSYVHYESTYMMVKFDTNEFLNDTNSDLLYLIKKS